MSWQTYVDSQICGSVDCKFACIAGLANGQIWAQKGNSVTEDEIRLIGSKITSDPAYFQTNGIILGGAKYICITAEKNLLRGRKDKNGLCIVATNTCLLIAVANDGVVAGTLNNVVEKLGDYLRNNSY